MYYNKTLDTLHNWWRTYLLFKCCILVIPIYTFLLLIGLCCIIYRIEVQSSLKTIYELMLLFLSAATIFIIVLLLATLKGSHSTSSDCDNHNDCIQTNMPIFEKQTKSSWSNEIIDFSHSITSSIMSTLFDNFDEMDDAENCYDCEFDLDHSCSLDSNYQRSELENHYTTLVNDNTNDYYQSFNRGESLNKNQNSLLESIESPKDSFTLLPVMNRSESLSTSRTNFKPYGHVANNNPLPNEYLSSRSIMIDLPSYDVEKLKFLP